MPAFDPIRKIADDITTSTAPLSSPAFTGVPTAPTAAPGTDTTQLATTAFVTAADDTKAPLDSPALTGIPTAPTAAPGTDTTQLATTAFVTDAVRRGNRPIPPNAPVVLAETDDTIRLHSTDASDVAVQMTATCPGHAIDVVMDVRSSTGSYTLAAKRGGAAGDVLLDAAAEGCRLVCDGTEWEVVFLFGDATWS